MIVFQATAPVTFPVGEYDVTINAPCPGVDEGVPFTVKVRGQEGDDVIIFNQGGTLSAIQVWTIFNI